MRPRLVAGEGDCLKPVAVMMWHGFNEAPAGGRGRLDFIRFTFHDLKRASMRPRLVAGEGFD